jgi:hypothetical protein
MSVQNYDCLIEIISDTSLKQKFSELPLADFSYSLLQEYSQVTKCAVLKLLPFPTTYLREAGFQFMRQKSKYRHRVDVAHDMRLQFSTITPKLKNFVRRR